jgi:anionic cell wall polymer biosynthesis LytR-Cps2A-Psr (LCP) family protein
LPQCKKETDMKKTRIDASAFLLILIALLLIAGVVFAATSFRSDPIEEFLSGDRVINTLFIIEDNDKPLCSYVLMYYPATKRAAIFDIPGSLGLIIRRINRVDRIDRMYDPNRITPFADEIENLLGVEIPFSIVITLENLIKITDLLEGVELFIPSPVDEYQDGYILFPSGLSYLDGDKAKLYITYELPEESSELAVYRRQRFFMGFIKRLGMQSALMNNPQTEKVFYSLLKTGVKAKNQVMLFNEFAGIDADRINIQSVSGNVREVSGQNLIFPHWDGNLIKEIARQTIAGLVQPLEGTLGDRIFTVEVLNGTTVSGLAGRTAELFRGFGYDVISIGNADRSDYEKTVIIDRSGLEDMIMAFGDVIRCTNIRYEPTSTEEAEIDSGLQNFNYQADLTLIIGRDFNGRYVAE